jgi:hypothetical protein
MLIARVLHSSPIVFLDSIAIVAAVFDQEDKWSRNYEEQPG